ncbi:hypothetical protein KX724_07685 [Stenotrophomonas indicatrix]|uniref:hypothetical protein n=1 Tax=Stenotrophomonas indicatrix TaxID=2045451 RepID=UPI001C4E9C8B|nr:hypothetical protein [Stenotrophomonas indicatrix]QXQ03963.1 hypothetical protein KX724_07685 [Stenotrophomonas indicatrix]
MAEYFWRLVASALSCDPRASTCVIDWDVVSAVATAFAVVVAMGAIWVENKHRNGERTRADRIRKDDLDAALRREQSEVERIAEARKSRARRLAKIFDRELTEAARVLIPLMKLLQNLTPSGVAQFSHIYAKPLNPGVFKMHERFLDQLDVFPDLIAIAIVNNMTNWTSITLFSEGLEVSPGVDLIRVRHKLLADLGEVLQLIGETKDLLEPYFADLPGLQILSLDQVRAMNEAKAEAYRRRHEKPNASPDA